MERDAQVFCDAVNLDSVSTFESIVSGTDHFFMEVNTRIQVEHRVTEMAYRLKFTNPDDKNDFFYLDSLIEAMAMLSVHGKRVPKPERVVRNISGAEVRINATNRSLQPHAGGIIQSWSAPLPGEIRDDQGIGTRNPDTGAFVHYHLAGAYDSNIALVIAYGVNRRDNLEKLADILRMTELRGVNLETNLLVHYGLTSWILGKDAMFKPSTQFMTSYLAGIGSLVSISRDIDLEIVWKHIVSQSDPAAKSVLARKMTLVIRPIEKLLSNPHVLGGFIGLHDGKSWASKGKTVEYLKNPVEILDDLYHYLHLEDRPNAPASEKIWDHDEKILKEARSFYKELSKLNIASDWLSLDKALNGSSAPKGVDSAIWSDVQAAHKGFQVGLNALNIIVNLGSQSGFSGIQVDDQLNAVVPNVFTDSKTRDPFIKALSPPPKASSDEIIAPMGGMFYAREAPNLPPIINEGDRFEAGQPLFIIEVMKMFNKISAPFSGTITKNLMQDSDGKIITKGQAIFKIEPDELIHEESEEDILKRKKEVSIKVLEG
jgi:biotin carboxyl carrier protein